MAVDIAGRPVGPGSPCYIIGEAGVNHNGRLETALEMVDAAAAAGVDAIKFQTFKAEDLATSRAPKAKYQVRNTPRGQSQVEMLRGLELDLTEHRELQARCRERGIVFLSTPFDFPSVDLLDSLKLPAFKLPSGEITNHPLLGYVAGRGKPVILSTGMSYLKEVQEAVGVLRKNGADKIVLLHCVSSYPAPCRDVNLRAMKTLQEATGLPVGYSDHTEGIGVALAAVALGACAIEKHFTLDRSLPGPDHEASLEPAELTELVKSIRLVEVSLGSGVKEPSPAEMGNRELVRKSIVATSAIAAGTVITREMLAFKRPGTGIAPPEVDEVVGRRAAVDIAADDTLQPEMLT